MPSAAAFTTPRAPRAGRIVVIVVALWLAACASKPLEVTRNPRTAPGSTVPAPVAPTPGPAPARDGPEAVPPPDLQRVPDAEPTLEPIRSGGPNKPYEISGQAYVPITKDASFTERGLASWYGRKFHGRRTASGELYNMYAMTAAHKTLPIPSYARVRNPATGAEVVVRVNDRGPFVTGRIVDLSYTAALKLGVLRGVAAVEVERITFDDIRTGAWRRDATNLASASAVAAPPAPPVTTVAETSAPAAIDGAADAAAVVAALPSAESAVATVAAAPAPAATPVASAAASQRAYTAPARGFWVQLGAFRERTGAEDFQRRVMAEHDWLTPLLAVFIDLPLFRLQAGPYPSRDEARGAAEQIRQALSLVPLIVERR